MAKFNKNLTDKLLCLARGKDTDLDAYIQEVVKKSVVDDTKIESRVYHVKVDPNGRHKTELFVEALASYALEYAIPREKLKEANPENHNDSCTEIVRLHRQAVALFTDLATSGEGGELLLYALAERVLKLPQIVCKMSLKTSSKMHFHGADGVHAGINEKGQLALYWGESKLHASPSKAMSECFESLKSFMHANTFIEGEATNDFQLIFKSPNIPDEDDLLIDAVVSYFDHNHENAMEFETRAIALVGFDDKAYANKELDNDKLLNELSKNVGRWKKSLKYHSSKAELEKFVMHTFVLPLPSVDKFRKSMLRNLGIKDAE